MQACATPPMDPGEAPPARQLLPAVGAMKFWARIFQKSMDNFNEKYEEPKPRTIDTHTYCIRDKTNWLGVYDELEAARRVWKGKGVLKDVKRGMRTVLERAQVLRQPVGLGCDIEYVSPVFAAIQIIVDAGKEASKVRIEVSDALGENLEEKFGLIEQFLAIFENDEVVEGAAVKLITSMLKAVEDVIGYYTKNMLLKGGAALLRGEDYQKHLKESLERVKSSCENLILQAKTSDMYQTRKLWTKVHDGYRELLEEQNQLNQSQQIVKDNTQEILELQQREATKLSAVIDLLEGYQRNLDQHQQLLFQNGEQNYVSNTQKNAYFSNFAMDALDINHWNLSPQPQPTPMKWITQHELGNLLGVADLDEIDMQYIKQRKGQYPGVHRARVEQLVTNAQFRDWVSTLASQILLIHGDFGEPSKNHVSALSLFSTTFVEALKSIDRLLPLVFFCGCHLDPSNRPIAGEGIIKSLISQLLRQQAFDTRYLHHEIDMSKVNNGDVGELCVMFCWLVRQVPENVTLFCLIDGIVLYERSDYEYTMGQVLAYLLDMTRELSIRCVLKVLITSPIITAKVRQHPAFYAGANILSMATMPLLGQESSEARLARQLAENLSIFA